MYFQWLFLLKVYSTISSYWMYSKIDNQNLPYYYLLNRNVHWSHCLIIWQEGNIFNDYSTQTGRNIVNLVHRIAKLGHLNENAERWVRNSEFYSKKRILRSVLHKSRTKISWRPLYCTILHNLYFWIEYSELQARH